MDLVKSPLVLILSFGLFSLLPAFGQTPPPKSPPVFSLLNLVRSPQPTVLKIGSEPVGEGQMSLGFYTGIVTWLPTVPLVAESPGFGPLRIPVFASKPGECPLLVLQDALEKPAGGGDPKPVLKYTTVANAKDRPANFADGLNLTSRETLTGNLAGKPISLEKGKRTRISTANGFSLELADGPAVSVSPSEVPQGLLVVFYENLDGKIEFAMTNDARISP